VGGRAHEVSPLVTGLFDRLRALVRHYVCHHGNLGRVDHRINAGILRWRVKSLLADGIDRQIVAALAENARSSYAEIGDRVGLSAPAVKRRVDRLHESGVIIGYTAVLNPDVTGTGTEAFVELWCRNRTSPADILAMVRDEPEVVGAYTVSGDADALLHLRTRDITSLEETLERIHAHQNTERTKSVIVLSRLVDRHTGALQV
jgi:DNA-binding Lrp family transcriptional regulator